MSRLCHSTIRKTFAKNFEALGDHYNRSRPHSAIGPGIPTGFAKPSAKFVRLPINIKSTDRIIATPILGGLHHDYQIMVA